MSNPKQTDDDSNGYALWPMDWSRDQQERLKWCVIDIRTVDGRIWFKTPPSMATKIKSILGVKRKVVA